MGGGGGVLLDELSFIIALRAAPGEDLLCLPLPSDSAFLKIPSRSKDWTFSLVALMALFIFFLSSGGSSFIPGISPINDSSKFDISGIPFCELLEAGIEFWLLNVKNLRALYFPRSRLFFFLFAI